MEKQKGFERGAGILLPIYSLPSKNGMGTLGREALSFVDFLAKSGQKFWQVLPIGPTQFGNSPYQSSSAFAGNPLLIESDMVDGDSDCGAVGGTVRYIDYDLQYAKKEDQLREHFKIFVGDEKNDFDDFCRRASDWLEDFSLFLAIKSSEGGRAWYEWSDAALRDRRPAALAAYAEENQEEIRYHKFVQYLFFKQWHEMRKYAREKGISIIGDVPIYVSLDSADVWACREDYLLDACGRPTCVAGVPPDLFSSTGQLWGNPIYNWDNMRKNGFKWWQRRYSWASELYDVIRIDHFIGIVNYYSVPAYNNDAVGGEWHRGPGRELIEALQKVDGAYIIAEDLGVVTEDVRALMADAGYPGMRILQFGLDGDLSNPHYPSSCPEGCVYYGGTHDNETLRGFVSRMGDGERKRIAQISASPSIDERSLTESLLRLALASPASLVIFQLQDYLMLGDEARMNVPSTLGGRNWRWTLGDSFDRLDSLAPYIATLTRESGR